MKAYTTREIAQLLAITPARVRSLARAGLLEPDRGPRGEFRFSFQDIVLLRAAQGLASARIPAGRIRRALCALKAQLPRGRSLSEVRITAEGDEVVVRDEGQAWNPASGQLHLDFSVAELAGDVAPLAPGVVVSLARDAGGPRIANAWYELGLDLESHSPPEARRAYARAIELDPEHADALVNLGRLLYEAGELAEAESLYRRALAARPTFATAAFNLGIVLEDLGRREDAERAYLDALDLDPDFADAHFNLARLYEAADDRAAALRHLRDYRRLTERSHG